MKQQVTIELKEYNELNKIKETFENGGVIIRPPSRFMNFEIRGGVYTKNKGLKKLSLLIGDLIRVQEDVLSNMDKNTERFKLLYYIFLGVSVLMSCVNLYLIFKN